MSGPKKYDYIDIVRGIAILAVVFVHSGSILHHLPPFLDAAYAYGNLGVQLFFVASALTLCMSMTNRQEADWTNFFIRRFFRIAPIFYCGIIFYFFWHLLINYHETGAIALSEGDTLSALFLNVFFLHGLSPAHFNYLVPGAWSIGAEFAFYALFPFIFVVVRRGIGALLTLFALTWAVSVVGQLLLFNLVSPQLVEAGTISEPLKNDGFSFIYASIFNQLPVFLAGCAAYLLIDTKIRWPHLVLAALLCLTSQMLQVSQAVHSTINGAFYATLSAIGFAIGVVWLANQAIVLNTVNRWLIRIGQLSFAIYIGHFAVISVLHLMVESLDLEERFSSAALLVILFAIATLASTAIAQIIHTRIEQPGIALGKKVIAYRAGRRDPKTGAELQPPAAA